ncbi:hypothetical protein [Jiangella sp. DSM 45060]|uniref:hypothetical protein n=1 Tax=Jiangella sp. DSM 45060 TaxID=1798224 RepID=UPI0012FD3767|nr:hypothetical protein [Jiangella sp. DSM 45060]
MTDVVDVDDEDTWPEPVREFVRRHAKTFGADEEDTGDLEDYGFAAGNYLRGRLLKAYHCTRLLDHEKADIQQDGLRKLDSAMIEKRLAKARACGQLTQEREIGLFDGYNDHDQQFRNDQVSAVVGRRAFDDQPEGFWRLLSTWGGEAIYHWYDDHTPEQHYLRSLGTPSIVVVHLDLNLRGSKDHFFSPALGRTFLRAHLKRDNAHCAVSYACSIPSEHIIEIQQPGDPAYDAHPHLPSK